MRATGAAERIARALPRTARESGQDAHARFRLPGSRDDRDGRDIPVELSITRTEQFGEPDFLGFLRDSTERRELSISELNHRVRNTLEITPSKSPEAKAAIC